jgi:hypothetical protein
MKYITGTILIIGSVVLAVAYTTPKQSTTEVSVLRDLTSPELAQPQADTILPLFNLSNDAWNGAQFRFADISNVSYTPVKEATINTANQWLSNELERNKEVSQFNGNVENILIGAQNEKVGRWHSSIYAPIAMELNRMAQSPAQHKVLIVYSDLMENNYDFSFYCPKGFSLLQTNPAIIEKYFENEVPLGQLNGIQVYFIYQPTGTISDWQYSIVSKFYQNLLKQKGAIVTVEANLQ